VISVISVRGIRVSARACSVRSTSCFEIRPPRPLPFTSSGAIPLSVIAFRADGAALTEPPFVVEVGAGAAFDGDAPAPI
jgi:hypothetical protein